MKELLSFIGVPLGSGASIIGLVYDFMPFMIMPLYSTLIKMDRSFEEAAADLGASKVKVFSSVTLPLSMPGIASGVTMVFMPTISSYVISDILSEYNVVLFGTYIDLYFNQNDWNFGSFMALIMLILILLSVVITRKFSNDDEGRESIW